MAGPDHAGHVLCGQVGEDGLQGHGGHNKDWTGIGFFTVFTNAISHIGLVNCVGAAGQNKNNLLHL